MADPVKIETATRKDQDQPPASGRMRPIEEMENWIQDMFPRMTHPEHWSWPSFDQIPRPFEGKMPRVDVIDHEKEIIVKAEMPGVSKEDLDITTTNNTVTLKGSSRYEHKEEKGDYYRSEMAHGVFARTVALPAEVSSDKAEAKFKDGLLELTLPKLPPKEGHKIQVE